MALKKLQLNFFKNGEVYRWYDHNQGRLIKNPKWKFIPNIDISYNEEEAFRLCAELGKFEAAKFLYGINPNINVQACEEEAFCWTCCSGEFEYAKWLYEICPNINISVNNEEPFVSAISNGYLDISKWLLEIKPDIDINLLNDDPFLIACNQNFVEVALFLKSLKPERYELEINEDNNEIIQFNIIEYLTITGDKILLNEEICVCSICTIDKSTVITNCNHQYCYDCLNKWNIKNINSFTCPYCRSKIREIYKISTS